MTARDIVTRDRYVVESVSDDLVTLLDLWEQMPEGDERDDWWYSWYSGRVTVSAAIDEARRRLWPDGDGPTEDMIARGLCDPDDAPTARASRKESTMSATRTRVNPFPPHRRGLWKVRAVPYLLKERWPEAPFGDAWRALKAKIRATTPPPRCRCDGSGWYEPVFLSPVLMNCPACNADFSRGAEACAACDDNGADCAACNGFGFTFPDTRPAAAVSVAAGGEA